MGRTQMQGLATMAEGPDAGWGKGSQLMHIAATLRESGTLIPDEWMYPN